MISRSLRAARCRSRRLRDVVGAGPNSQLVRSHPAIDPEETRDPVAQEGPETFSFVPRSAWATGDEPRSLHVGHDSIVAVCRSPRSPRIAAGCAQVTVRRVTSRAASRLAHRADPPRVAKESRFRDRVAAVRKSVAFPAGSVTLRSWTSEEHCSARAGPSHRARAGKRPRSPLLLARRRRVPDQRSSSALPRREPCAGSIPAPP